MKRKEKGGQEKEEGNGIGGSKWKKTEEYRKGKRREKYKEVGG